MLKDIVLNVEPREEIGKNASVRLRKRGLIPAILYGMGQQAVPISVDPKKLLEILTSDTGENTIFSIQVSGREDKNTVMIKDYQRDPVHENIIHADFIKIDLREAIEVDVPLQLVGVPLGVKQQGGILDFIVREVRVSCFPADIPEKIDVDVSQLLIGQHLSISSIAIPDKVKILDEPEQTIVVVSAPKIEEVAAPAAAPVEEMAEPEIIKKGKEEKAEEGEKAEAKEEKGEAKEKKEKK
ncbi:MAG: 50S ribosomal protein L25 [Acidobacteriota bacterium]